MNDCIFCSIANGDKSKLIWEDDFAVAFHDINPEAPVHVLVVPKQHFQDLGALSDGAQLGQLLLAAKAVAKLTGIESAYRLHINNGHAAGQEIDHLHLHLLGNKPDTTMDLDKLRQAGL